MKSVRIQPSDNEWVMVDVTCDCGKNGLAGKKSGVRSTKHAVKMCDNSEDENDKELICECGKVFCIHPQKDHIHVTELGVEAKMVLHHDDHPCRARLMNGFCSDCGFAPDMQSTCLLPYCPSCSVLLKFKNMQCPQCLQLFVRPK